VSELDYRIWTHLLPANLSHSQACKPHAREFRFRFATSYFAQLNILQKGHTAYANSSAFHLSPIQPSLTTVLSKDDSSVLAFKSVQQHFKSDKYSGHHASLTEGVQCAPATNYLGEITG
jgi:hypothetical protein